LLIITTYDEIYVSFLTNCQTEDINLPQAEEKIYEVIRNAVRYYNNRTRMKILCIDETETLNQIIDDDQLLIIANYIRLTFLENQLIHFSTVWQPFSKDLGLKNFQTQSKALESQINLQKIKIDELFRNIEEDFM
jgi:hypothetical protein